MKRRILGAAAVAALLGLGLLGLKAQTISVPTVLSVGPTDLFQDVVRGAPQASSYYATAAAINNVQGYQIAVPLTGFSLTFGNTQTYYLIQPAGTLATGTFTFAALPGDGAKECVRSTQTQTAVTMTANTGQTVGGTAVTAFVANTTYCWIYQASSSTWYPI